MEGEEEEGLLCILVVAYAEGKFDRIPVRLGDEPAILAAAFRKKHALGLEAEGMLTDVISQTMKGHLEEVERGMGLLEAGKGRRESGEEGGVMGKKEGEEEIAEGKEEVVEDEEETEGEEPRSLGGESGSEGEEEQEEEEVEVKEESEEEDEEEQRGQGNDIFPEPDGLPTTSTSPSPPNTPPATFHSSSPPPTDTGEALFNRLKGAWMRTGLSSSFSSPSSPSSPSSSLRRQKPTMTMGGGNRVNKGLQSPAPLPISSSSLSSPSLITSFPSFARSTGSINSPRHDGQHHPRPQPKSTRLPAAAEDAWRSLTCMRTVDAATASTSPVRHSLPSLHPPLGGSDYQQSQQRKEGRKGKAGGRKGERAFERLYLEAKLLQQRKEEALQREIYREAKERRDRTTAIAKRSREVMGKEGKQVLQDAGHEDIGWRLFNKGQLMLRKRDEACEKAAARRRREAEGPKEEGEEDWLCPRCFHSNEAVVLHCQRVVGRKTALSFLLPKRWTKHPGDVTIVNGRRIAEDADIFRCDQPRPQAFHPTIVSLEQHPTVHSKSPPPKTRTRAANIFQRLFATRKIKDEKYRAAAIEREKEELLGCTFHPEISTRSCELAEARERGREERLVLTDEELEGLTSPEAILKKKREILATEKMMGREGEREGGSKRCAHVNPAVMHECTFQPNVGLNKSSNKSVSSESMAATGAGYTIVAAGEEEGGRPREVSDEEQEDWEKGRKARNSNSNSNKSSSSSTTSTSISNSNSSSNVFVRLAEADLEKRRRSLRTLTQTLTEGEGTYKPMTTGRRTLSRDLAVCADGVSEYLYGLALARLAKRKRKEEEAKRRPQRRFMAAGSERLVEAMKEKTFRFIFESLFPEEGGVEREGEGCKEVLLLKEATLERISHPHLAEALGLVLSHASSSSSSSYFPFPSSPSPSTLDFATFSLLLDRHLRASMPLIGHMLTHICQPEEEAKDELAFHPAINEKSERLAGERWSSRTRDEVYHLLHAEAALSEGRKEEARREKASRILDGYTFQPVLMTKAAPGERKGRKEGRREGGTGSFVTESCEEVQESTIVGKGAKPDPKARSKQGVRVRGRAGRRTGGRTKIVAPQRKKGACNRTIAG